MFFFEKLKDEKKCGLKIAKDLAKHCSHLENK